MQVLHVCIVHGNARIQPILERAFLCARSSTIPQGMDRRVLLDLPACDDVQLEACQHVAALAPRPCILLHHPWW